MNKTQIIVALDVDNQTELEYLLKSFAEFDCWFKVGMQLYYSLGPKAIELIKQSGQKIFLDLKIHDIPNTAKGATQSLVNLGVDMINFHAAGGIQMMKAAKELVQLLPPDKRPILIGVTQLTSTNEMTLNNELLIKTSMKEAVLQYASLVHEAGLDGVVCSAHEVPEIKSHFGEKFLCVTPGIRLSSDSLDDQCRVMTPALAAKNGSDYLVIGRSITKAANPASVLKNIYKDIQL